VPLEQASVIALLPRGDEVVVLDFAGRLRTLSLADGRERRSTQITGGLTLVHGTAAYADEDRVSLLYHERTKGGATLGSFDLSTGRAAWVRPLASARLQAAQLHRSGAYHVAVLSRYAPRSGAAVEVRVVDAATGEEVQSLQSPGLQGGVPTSALQDGTLVVVGQEGAAVYRGSR
jgi:outer membrane protein assembly factor BamB